MNCDQSQPYFTELLQGKLEEAFEYRIKAHVSKCPHCKEHLEEVETTWEELKRLPLIEPDSSLKMNFYSMLQQYKEGNIPEEKEERKRVIYLNFTDRIRKFSTIQWVGIAASVTSIFLAGYLTSQLSNSREIDQLIQQETAQSKESTQSKEKKTFQEKEIQSRNVAKNETVIQEDEDRQVNDGIMAFSDEIAPVQEEFNPNFPSMNSIEKSLAEVLDEQEIKDDAFVNLEEASERGLNRIKSMDYKSHRPVFSDEKIAFFYENANNGLADDQVIEVLMDAFNTDANPNVRIAALEALERVASDPATHNKIAKALKYQEVPTVQMATIDLIYRLGVKDGGNALKELLKRKNLHESVKEYAREVLKLYS